MDSAFSCVARDTVSIQLGQVTKGRKRVSSHRESAVDDGYERGQKTGIAKRAEGGIRYTGDPPHTPTPTGGPKSAPYLLCTCAPHQYPRDAGFLSAGSDTPRIARACLCSRSRRRALPAARQATLLFRVKGRIRAARKGSALWRHDRVGRGEKART